MNAICSNPAGYTPSDNNLRPLRRVEYDALAHASRQLSIAWRQRKSNFSHLAEALSDNLALWTAFADDVASDSNPLPSDLKAKIFYLYEFTHQQSLAVLSHAAGVECLIDINTAIMRGLRGQGGDL